MTKYWVVGLCAVLFVTGGMLMYTAAHATTYRTTNKVGPAACFTEKAYEDYAKAAIHARSTRDVSWMKHLYDTRQCFRMEKELRVTVEDSGFTVSQIRIFPRGGGTPILAWTSNENFSAGIGLPEFSAHSIAVAFMWVLIPFLFLFWLVPPFRNLILDICISISDRRESRNGQ